jgi:polyisoprenoid-binding protein YceI
MESIMKIVTRRMVVVVQLLSLTGVGLGAAPSSEYVVSRELSAVSFTVYKWGVLKEEGRFKEIAGRLYYDPARLQDSTVDMTVNVASLDTSNGGRDNVLRSADFFDVQRYPTMRFVSHRVQPRQDKTLGVSGDLTIHGVTKPIDIVVTVNGVNEVAHVGRVAGFETTFHIDRTAFGVNGSKWSGGKLLISADVEIHMAIAAANHPLYKQTERKR